MNYDYQPFGLKSENFESEIKDPENFDIFAQELFNKCEDLDALERTRIWTMHLLLQKIQNNKLTSDQIKTYKQILNSKYIETKSYLNFINKQEINYKLLSFKISNGIQTINKINDLKEFCYKQATDFNTKLKTLEINKSQYISLVSKLRTEYTQKIKDISKPSLN